jgi:SAM-dependent methyltransferase
MKKINGSLNMQRLMEKAPTGLHDFCEELIERYFDRSNNILDIAAGTGAMARRLVRKGYLNINANDIDFGSFEAKEIEFTSINLNSQFADRFQTEAFDGILAIEIIEHLDNSLAFLSQCSSILKNNGYLLITTPNILGSESLLQWLRKGHYLYFSPEWYQSIRHVSILPSWLLDAKIIESGMKIVYRGYTPRLLKRNFAFTPRNMMGSIAIRFIDIILRGFGRPKAEIKGTNYVVLCNKQNNSQYSNKPGI